RVGQRHPGRQARGRVHLNQHDARRPGVDPADDDAAAAAPRLRGCRHPVHRTRPQHHPQWRHAVWREPLRRAQGRPGDERRGSQAGARAGAADRGTGGEARQLNGARRTVRFALLALAALFVAWFGLGGDWVALAVFALPPLLLAAWLPRAPVLAGFWAGVFALGWFSHGVMVAWS